MNAKFGGGLLLMLLGLHIYDATFTLVESSSTRRLEVGLIPAIPKRELSGSGFPRCTPSSLIKCSYASFQGVFRYDSWRYSTLVLA